MISRLSLIFIGLILTMSSCRKYEDGPTLTLRTAEGRLSRTWKLERYFFNGSDQTAFWLNQNFIETFSKDGAYSFSYIDPASGDVVAGMGKWEFQNRNREVRISGVSKASTETYIIRRLTTKEFWYEILDSKDLIEVRMKAD